MNTITLQAGESVTIVAAGGTTPPVEPPVEPPVIIPPPVVIPPPEGGQTVNVDAGAWGDYKKTDIVFGLHDVVCVAMHTGSGPSQTVNLPFIRAAESQGSMASMDGALSDTPGSFTPLSPGSGGTSVSFRVANPIDPPTFPYPNYYANLDPNRTYYLNLRNSVGNGVTGSRQIMVEIKTNGCP